MTPITLTLDTAWIGDASPELHDESPSPCVYPCTHPLWEEVDPDADPNESILRCARCGFIHRHVS